MAKIEFSGNVGNVETGETEDSFFISFSVAENYSIFNQETQEWESKGVEWRQCTYWIDKDNTKKFERLKQFIITGAGVLITGRTNINPSEEKDEKGNPRYLNHHVVVNQLGLTTERLELVQYKDKATRRES